jgi:pimeloyl-ACP methyl ester carboxylesterase
MSVQGSAVLVHGSWGNPEDWRWVRQHLESDGVHVQAPDLPSHRSADAGLEEDAEEVRQAISSCPAPVVVVGWSYGGDVISVAATGGTSVTRLLYIAAIPSLPDGAPADLSWMEDDPHILVGDGTHVLDDEWWLNEEAGTTFTEEVLQHLRQHRRRPMSLRTESPSKVTTAPPWETIPTTVLLGIDDDLVPAEERERAKQCTDDVRLLETDHFIIVRQPELVSKVIIDALQES